MASPPLSNDFDGGTDTNTIATSDTGSGDQWNTVDSTPTYSSDHYFTTLSMENSIGGTFARNGVRWTGLGSLTASVYSRMYLWIDASPGTAFLPTQYRASGGGACAAVELMNTRYFRTLDAASAVVNTGTIQPPTGEWVRIEFRVDPDASAGDVELRWYSSVSPGDGYNGTTATETLLTAGSVATAANIDEVRYGMTGTTGPTSWTQWVDECGVATSGWIGPSTTTQILLPDADVADGGWVNELGTATPLWSKLNDASDSTYITDTAS